VEGSDPSTKNEDSSTNSEENKTKVDQNFDPINSTNDQRGSHHDLPRSWKIVKDYPTDLIIGDALKGVKTRYQAPN